MFQHSSVNFFVYTLNMKAIIVDIAPKNLESESGETFEDRLRELENLVKTYDGIIVLESIQKRDVPDYRTYIGSGKLDETIDLADHIKADVIIIGNILKPAQIYNINQQLEDRKLHEKIQAWDRVDLILKIFERHATTPEAKLQIQLASIKHMWPRIFGMGMELDRQAWGIGASGIGETNTEIMKRHLQQQEKSIRKKLEKIGKTRDTNRKGRHRSNLKTVWLVGYTNAGKSTLMNRLTKKWVLQEDKLFATLGTSIAKMKLEKEDYYDEEGRFLWQGEILINDSIGFIRDLPPKLIDAFTSTLEESVQSDLLLHIIDASDPKIADRIQITDEILDKIWAKQKRIYVLNQIDKISDEKLQELLKIYEDLSPICISAFDDIGIPELKKHILSEV